MDWRLVGGTKGDSQWRQKQAILLANMYLSQRKQCNCLGYEPLEAASFGTRVFHISLEVLNVS